MTMSNHIEETMPITAQPVPMQRCADFLDALFGAAYPLELEPAIFHFASTLSSSYRGGVWTTNSLSNGGFFVKPEGQATFVVRSPNGYEGDMSADAFGICCVLFATSNCSFGSRFDAERKYAEAFHRLRDFAAEHPEASEIFAATD